MPISPCGLDPAPCIAIPFYHLSFNSLIITLISNVMPVEDYILAEGQTGTM